MNIVLIGYRCAGKTSVGRDTSRRLGIPFLDTDELVVARCGKGIAEIVMEGGWESFRDLEKEVMRGLSPCRGAVIAVGGGAIEDAENREIIRRLGLVIWLRTDATVVLQRMKGDEVTPQHRPPLCPGSMEQQTAEVLRKRVPLYRELADLILDTSAFGIETVATEICDFVRARGIGLGPHPSRKG